MNRMIDKLRKHLDSEAGQRHIEEYVAKIKHDRDILESQMRRFHERYASRFEEVVEKVIAKYSSGKYRDSWYGRGIEPPESLYWFLLEYAGEYGRKCTKAELTRYGNIFTSELYYINGYYFNRMDGQGSVVQVERKIG